MCVLTPLIKNYIYTVLTKTLYHRQIFTKGFSPDSLRRDFGYLLLSQS